MNISCPNPAYHEALANARGLPLTAARSWSILLTSANHGTVGPVGTTFPHAGEKHERVVVVEVVEAGAPAAPGADLAGLVRIDVADLIDRLDDVHSWARDLPIPTPGTVSAMHNVRKVKEALGAAPVAAQAGQVAPAEDLARFCPACGLVGDVGAAYRDCCPDGGEARRIPKSLAEKCRELFKAALNSGVATGQVAVPEGWKLVPLEPTEEMVGCAWMIEPPRMFGEAYRAMLAAAPSAPAVAQQAPADWISVDDMDPPERELIAVRYWPYDNRENPQAVTGGRYIDGTFYNDEGNELHPPSHWCRLPQFDEEATAQASTPGESPEQQS